MIREAKRKDLEYKRHSTVELAKYLTIFPTINIFDQVKEIVEDGISELNDDDDGDLQMKPMYLHFKTLTNNSRLLLRANLYSLASAGFQPAIDLDKVQNAIWIINLFNSEIPIATVWSTRIAICKAAQAFITKCIITPTLDIPQDAVSSLWKSLKIVAGDRGYESVRTAAAKTVAEFFEWVEGHSEWVHVQQQIKSELPGIIEAETSSVIQAEYRR
jgi:hypothetical protein